MPAKQLSELPSEVQSMPEGAKNIFLAALNSALSDGMDEPAAMKVAWTTVKHEYVQTQDGQWQPHPEEENLYNKAVNAAGN